MKKFLIFGAVTAMMCGTLIGCTKENDADLKSRLVVISEDGCEKLVYDKETRVEYLIYAGYQWYGITVLLDADGKPLLYTENE